MHKSIVPVDQITGHSSTSYEFSNPNEAEIVELEDDPLDVVERKMEGLKLNHQFKEENVPQFFRTFVIDKIDNLLGIELEFYDSYCTIKLDGIKVRFEKRLNDWMICYNYDEKPVKSNDPEKSIIDHLWFALKHPKLELEYLAISNLVNSRRKNTLLNFEKFELLLLSMLESIGHQIHTSGIAIASFTEDTFLSILQHMKAETLIVIGVDISWKKDGNYQKLNEVVETDQWKRAKGICSYQITPLKIEDFFHCEWFSLSCDEITPEDVLRVKDHIMNNTKTKKYELDSKEHIDINEIEKVLPSNCQREERFDDDLGHQTVYTYKIPNSRNSLIVELSEYLISFTKNASSF